LAALRALEVGAAVLLALAVVVGANGILYLLRPHVAGWPGPGVREALPLDELAGHSTVPLIAFAVVWAFAGVAIGALAMAARVERLTAGLLAALVTGGFLYAADGLSIFVVRQIQAGSAFKHALYLPGVYLASTLAGIGGAVLGRAHRRSSRQAPIVLSVFVAVSGVLDVASVITPAIDSRLRLIEDAMPNVVPRLASAFVVPAGLALIVLARGLRRRRWRAWQLATAMLVAAALLHMLRGLDYEEAIANSLLAIALIARRHDFQGRGDPAARRYLLARVPLYAAAVLAYGVAALWVNRVAADRPFTLAFAAQETGESAAGMYLSGSQHLSGQFGEWFPLSVFLLTLLALFSLLWAWLAPWRHRVLPHERERRRAQTIVEAWGLDTLSPFALRGDKSYFFAEDEEAFLAYTVVAGVAVVSGDPVGPDDHAEPLLRRFIGFAHDHDWRIGVLGVGERHVDVYRGLGLKVVYHGDEAVVEVADFSLDGRAIRKVRQSVARLEREGYAIDIRHAGEIAEDERADLEAVAAAWRGDAPERGFTMELDTLFRLDGEDALFVIGRDRDGVVRGFLHFAVLRRALSLSSMPRLLDTPNGFNEWLVAETIGWAKERSFERVSLNFAPFAAVFADDADAGARLLRGALQMLKFRFQLDNLLAFNRKFFPHWEHRYVVYEHLGDLPRVGLAGLAAEGYLSLPGGRR
jgi:lysyl-tRNA synthetase class 2